MSLIFRQTPVPKRNTVHERELAPCGKHKGVDLQTGFLSTEGGDTFVDLPAVTRFGANTPR